MFIRAGIVGRPNVGKSTLFNCLIGRSRAIVGNYAGVTRDYKEELLDLKNYKIKLFDTAGLRSSFSNIQDITINQHTIDIMNEFHIILFVIDGREGITLEDKELYQNCRKLNKPTVVIVNKVDIPSIEQNYSQEVYYFGIHDIISVSSEHRIGIDNLTKTLEDFCDKIQFKFKEKNYGEPEDKPINLAVVGRPNVGKSTLVNSIIQKKRFITGPEAGLTRDSNFVLFDWNKVHFKIYDTAGARKKRKIDDYLEKESVKETLRAIRFAAIVVLVLDPNNILNIQDQKLASLCEREGRAVVFVVNKADTITNKNSIDKNLKLSIKKSLPQYKGAYITYTSGLDGIGFDELQKNVMATYEKWNFKQSTAILNTWLKEKLEKHAPPMNKGRRRIKLKYIVQSNSRPPTLKIFTSHNGIVSNSYKKYLENSFREDFKLLGIPIRIIFKSGENPFSFSKS